MFNEETLSVAIPAAETVDVPTAVEPSKNVTFPEKAPPNPVVPLCTTVAVNWSAAPATAGFEAAAIVVVVAIGCIVSFTVLDVEVRLFASPPYCAVIVCGPPASALVVSMVVPVALSVAVPIGVVPSRNVTIPVGIAPSARATTEVNVTLIPAKTLAFDVAREVVVAFLVTV
jgi:hypothetical protein